MYGNYIFLNEVNKGVHIIDNTNPVNPVIKSFINIPGNVDIAVKGSTLYADLYTDLVVVDITDPLNATLKKVVTKVFPERVYAAGFVYDSTKVIVGWTERKIKETIDQPPAGRGWIRRDVFFGIQFFFVGRCYKRQFSTSNRDRWFHVPVQHRK